MPETILVSVDMGMPGKIWMAFVAALAVISSQNSSVQALSAIAQGMTKMNMMPQCFGRTNSHKVPYVGVWFVTIAILVCGYISQDSSERISFLIQVGSVFWMLSYIVAHIDLLVFRKRLPRAPRNFRVPGGPVLPLIGISGIVYMICNISTDFHTRMMIYLATGVTFAILSVWSILWIRFRMKMPLLKPVPINKVLAMENSMFYKVRRNKGLCR
jgi:amino acid transporter